MKKIQIKPNLKHMVRIGDEFFLNDTISIPCGKCFGCIQDRKKNWSLRMEMESSYNDVGSNWFGTLTYRDECCPDDVATVKHDLQNFFKSLRYYANSDFKYIACVEYGSNTFRLHAHFVATGLNLSGKFLADKTFKSPQISKSWDFGISYVVPSSPATIAYVCGYVNKKIAASEQPNPLLQTAWLYSKRLGYRWFLDHEESLRKYDTVYFHGKHKIPQYFDKLLEKGSDFLQLLDLEENKSIRKEKGERAKINSLQLHSYDLEQLQDFNESCQKSRRTARNVNL